MSRDPREVEEDDPWARAQRRRQAVGIVLGGLLLGYAMLAGYVFVAYRGSPQPTAEATVRHEARNKRGEVVEVRYFPPWVNAVRLSAPWVLGAAGLVFAIRRQIRRHRWQP